MSFNYKDVEKIYKKIKSMKQKGKNADYIPDLQIVNPNIYAISVCNIKGEIMKQSLGNTCPGGVEKNNEKIMRNILKETHIDKQNAVI